jgi:L-amino acid N-acyltransferase YncA
MSDAIIRPVRPNDVAAITRIYADAVKNGTATFEIEPR